ncbi:MAG TPA: DUF58 domain-containing protein [Flavitalea sp.]|nr:DUF58 domain-containing protein [Flavitalea sp.]
MNLIRQYLQSLFFSKGFYLSLASLIVLFVFAYFSPILFVIARIFTFVFFLLVIIDYIVLYRNPDGLKARRILPERLSNGDDNKIQIILVNDYSFRAGTRIIDELPVQFQRRDFMLRDIIPSGEQHTLTYILKPVERGEYIFYDLNVFVYTPLNLVVRRYKIPSQQMVKVYPSYFSLRKYDLLAYSNNLSESGNRRIRKIGQSVEFEQIREYVSGDDIRTINWKATARKGGHHMVNNYMDERSQQVYCIIDKGRVMKMPFEGMTLLDYAINASLILSRVALLKQDRAGLVTFSETIGQVLPAERRANQMNNILETLYDQKTLFGESNYEKLYALLRTRISQRSLIVLFTNFESLTALQRQLPYLRSIAKIHLVLVVFFENTELRQLTEAPVDDIESLYTRTIAEKFVHEKRLMVKELQQLGIFTILTAPEHLTINTVNKYLELKARQAI